MKTYKFSPRADACVLLGYSTTKKGYLLYDIAHNKFLINRDISFKGDVFPFAEMKITHAPLFLHIFSSWYGTDKCIDDSRIEWYSWVWPCTRVGWCSTTRAITCLWLCSGACWCSWVRLIWKWSSFFTYGSSRDNTTYSS